MQGKNRYGDTENRPVETVGYGKCRMNREGRIAIYTLSYAKKMAMGSCFITQGTQLGVLWQPKG